jgi:NitT/TauT family transport system substrate-binding protein
MTTYDARRFSRRRFLTGVTLAGTAGFLGMRPRSVAAEPPPETTHLRLPHFTAVCLAPQVVAEDLLRAEGFTDVQYVRLQQPVMTANMKALASGQADLAGGYTTNTVVQIDAGDPVVLLAGVHVGCFELFGSQRVRAVRDLRGRKVSVPEIGVSHHTFVSMMAAYVGLDPRRDIEWVVQPAADGRRSLAEGTVDAIMAFPPDPQELRAKKIGHVIVNSAVDRPWSQYLCCMVAGNKEFVRKHPVATKRAVRAMLKAVALCTTEPERVARLLVDRGVVKQYDYALQTVKELPYARWRDFDSEDTLRFYALRLYEAGLIKSSPQKLIAQGTDLRFVNELKKELKG